MRPGAPRSGGPPGPRRARFAIPSPRGACSAGDRVAPMRLFITGASGFIGSALYERYSTDRHEALGCDLVADPQRRGVAGDVAEPGAWQAHAAGCEIVIHTAASVSLRLERPEEI